MTKILPKQAPPKKSASRPTATIIIQPNNVAILDPAIPLVRPVVTCRRRLFKADEPTGVREVEAQVWAYRIDPRGRVAFPAGLVARAAPSLTREWLSSHGAGRACARPAPEP